MNTFSFPKKNNKNQIRLLLGQAAFQERPNWSSQVVTGVFFLAFLTISERSLQYALQYHSFFQQTLLHRQIVARYVGVDAVCCVIMAVAGIRAIVSSPFVGNNQQWQQFDYKQRLYAYYPTHYRVALFFSYYQTRDIVDSILWRDKPELIVHHLLSFMAAYGCLSSETGLFYAPFFFGLSEVSTIVLCCLVNFDKELGVPGLAEEFPRIKTIVGVVFVILFLIGRCMAWPYVSYYFCRDVWHALRDKNEDDPQLKRRKFWLYFFLVALSALSLLQVLWLGQIIVTALKEFA